MDGCYDALHFNFYTLYRLRLRYVLVRTSYSPSARHELILRAMKSFARASGWILGLLTVRLTCRPSAAIAATNVLPQSGIQAPEWPPKFHAVLVQNRSETLALVDHYYDFPAGASLLVIHSQLGDVLYDYEFQNGSTYYYNPVRTDTCKCINMRVGLVRPDFLRSSGTFAGSATRDGLDCLKWRAGRAPPPATGPFMEYFSLKQNASRPVSWTFFSGARFDVMRWSPGSGIPPSLQRLPLECLRAPCTTPTNDHAYSRVMPQFS